METMVPKIKRIKKEKGIKIPFLNIILVLFCSFLLMVSTFIQLDIKQIPLDFIANHNFKKADFVYSIIPQVPMVLFVVGLLGRRLSITSVVIYILTGLFLFPVFALGGGMRYVTEFGFGYILAYLPAAFFAGSILESGFSIKNILKAAFVGVFAIHIIGVLYMLFISAIRHEGWEFIKGWILAQSMIKVVYDYILSVIALFVAKYLNKYINYLLDV